MHSDKGRHRNTGNEGALDFCQVALEHIKLPAVVETPYALNSKNGNNPPSHSSSSSPRHNPIVYRHLYMLMICSVAPLRIQRPFLRMSPGSELCVCDRGLWDGHQGEAAAQEWITESNLHSPRSDQTAASLRGMPLSTKGMQQLWGGVAGWAG